MAQAAVVDSLATRSGLIHVVPDPYAAADPPAMHLARELHDGVAQDLATMLLNLEHFRAEQSGRQSVLSEIELLQDQLRLALFNIRQLIYDQRSMPGVEHDFAGAIRRGFVRRFAERTGIAVRLTVARQWPRALPAQTALNLYRIIQETLNNVDRHSGATEVTIRFEMASDGEGAVLQIADNGRGYPGLEDGWRAGLGLMGIEERALLLGAQATVANRKRGGSVLTLTLPGRCLRTAS